MTKTRTKKPSSTHYEGDEGGKPFKLARVTGIINKVTGDAKGGMSYWGAQLAIKFSLEHMSVGASYSFDYDEVYAEFKKSPFDPNKTKAARGKVGTAAHKLFERLLKGEAHVYFDADKYEVGIGDDPVFVPVQYDLAVVKAYVDIFSHLEDGDLESEAKVRWFEPGHPDDCPDEVCTHGFAGTSDYILPKARVGGDLKTHKGDARYTDFLQNGFYSVARKQMDGTEIDRHMVLLAREDGTYSEAYGFVGEDAVMAAYALYKDMVKGGFA